MYLEDQNRKVYTFAQIYVDSTLNIEYSINSSINKDRVLGWNINSFTLSTQCTRSSIHLHCQQKYNE